MGSRERRFDFVVLPPLQGLGFDIYPVFRITGDFTKCDDAAIHAFLSRHVIRVESKRRKYANIVSMTCSPGPLSVSLFPLGLTNPRPNETTKYENMRRLRRATDAMRLRVTL